MCGRYLIEDDTIADIYAGMEAGMGMATTTTFTSYMASLSTNAADFMRGEVFPTNIVPVITRDGAAAIKWGFPHWKNASVIINARAETAHEKSMFRFSLAERRCVVPSSGFYEWERVSGRKKKDKYLLRLPGEKLLCMAGIMNTFCDAAGAEYCAFVILTTTAAGAVARIHDRMPVILSPDERELWLGDMAFTQNALIRHGPDLELIKA